jgi:triosephosphate isomerase
MIVSNWKMNGTKSDIEHWVNKVSNKIDYKSHIKCIICPPSCYLDSTRQVISKIDSPIKLGSQEIDSTNSGALTGGINSQMLNDFSTEFVLIGHSEQRDHLNEDNITLRSKLDTAIQSGISVIFCIGEPAEVKLSGNTENFLSEQLDVLTSDDLDFITIAYEPIWAIGTGLNADNKYIQSIHLFIKDFLNKLNKEKNISVVYGGSVKLDNCEDILSCNNVDGLLIGGASLDPDTFSKIYNLS